jgi:hypothetical protein|tara:strand:- start:865 stop:1086 length:222 start_codon:yes stop_codon:yes gene_type:complete
MIYRNIEKVIKETPNDMELGKKIRRLYLMELREEEKEEAQVQKRFEWQTKVLLTLFGIYLIYAFVKLFSFMYG